MFDSRTLNAAAPSSSAYGGIPEQEQESVLHSSVASASTGRFGQLYGADASMQAVYEQISKVAPGDASVLIVGENGSGKELVAQTIHEMSPYAEQPFLAVNCGALPPTLIEAELFGYEKGAFTGAHREHAGYFERANGGTLFLDEIGEMPLELQVRLLRVLETRRIQRIGSNEEIECDIRIVAATNRDPMRAMQENRLREDLYYRLAEFPILLPPLRERGDDVLLLAQHFLEQANKRNGKAKRFAQGAKAKLKKHDWPGNVRELKNCVQRAYVMAEQEINIDTAGPFTLPDQQGEEALSFVPGVTTLADVERRFVLATLDHFHGDKRLTAEALGVSLKTVYNKLNHYLATNLHSKMSGHD